MDDRTHVLYRFYSATGQLLYVGITMNPPQRFKAHRDSKDWWSEVSGITVENYSSREDLANAERRAIQVEHPLRNIVHTKSKPKHREPEPTAQEPERPTVTDVAAGLFASSGSFDLGSLFNSRYKDTRYGYMTDEEYEQRVELERAKQQKRWDCPLCDSSGYRNGYLCDIDHSGESRFAAAWRRAQRQKLQVINGGDA
jgi:predicted GIY-YIG superfamily endonuclease